MALHETAILFSLNPTSQRPSPCRFWYASTISRIYLCFALDFFSIGKRNSKGISRHKKIHKIMSLIYNKFRNLQITFLGKSKKIFKMQLFLSPKVAIRILLGTHNSDCLCFVIYMGTKDVQTKHILLALCSLTFII